MSGDDKAKKNGPAAKAKAKKSGAAAKDKVSKKKTGKAPASSAEVTKPKRTVKKKKKVVTKSVIKPVSTAAPKGRDIGLAVRPPRKVCEDVNCPFHGKLPVRGQILEGVVVNTKMDKTAVVKKERLFYIKKYERYEKRTSRYSAHNPPCLKVDTGDWVKIAECRPLSKTVSFVIVERRKTT